MAAQGQVVAADAVLEPVGPGRLEDREVLAGLLGSAAGSAGLVEATSSAGPRRLGASIASGMGARTATVGGSSTSAVMPPYQECRSCTLML